MPQINVDLDMVRHSEEAFLEKAKLCKPDLRERWVHPAGIVEIERGDSPYPKAVWKQSAEELPKAKLKKGDRICLDFGEYLVGYVSMKLSSVGSPQDAPAFIKLKFGEIPKELTEDSKNYQGWISKSWIQEEYLHIDVLPTTVALKRRYAFRYLEIEVIDTSLKWQLIVEDVAAKSVSAVNDREILQLQTENELLRRIDQVSQKTLQSCMQTVFEDGPKRDRRLWLGDLRLQALVNYATFQENNLVKRCLYLFAGQTRDDGQVGACLFTEPEVLVDDTFLLDYSMLFGATLMDYYEATGDRETLEELSPCAYRQMELAKEWFDPENRLIPGTGFWGFIDWTDGLDKQAAMQGVYIYCAKRVGEIAKVLDHQEKISELQKEADEKSKAAVKYFQDPKTGLFFSGEERQINYASQVWMILAGVTGRKTGSEILDEVVRRKPEKKMVSPYMNHYFAEALFLCGRTEQALSYLEYYWGGMIRNGADTFWELYNPEDPSESPYGSSMVNSYCHAWSCTPAYLLRKYLCS